eukprot:gene17346-19078_t
MSCNQEKENQEVLLGENSDGIQCVDRLSKCKDAVCYLHLLDEENIRRGTGFFAKVPIKGEEYLAIVTNNHVLPREDIAVGGIARFNYEGSKPVIDIGLRPDLLFRTDPVLDYTLVGCDLGITKIGITPLEFANDIGKIGDSIFIFQHPKGESKKVSYHCITNVQRPYLFYNADTDVGSSGSPVFQKFRLIAVHSKGSDSMRYNKGVLCDEILQHLNYGTYTEPVKDPPFYMRKRESLTNVGTEESSPSKKQRTSRDLTKQPSEKELQSLARDIITEWKSLGRQLGVPNKDIMRIQKDHINYDDVNEKAVAMLLAWKEKQGQEATFGCLKEVLMSSGLVDTAQKHC